MIEKVGVTDAGCTVYRIGDKYWICPQYIYVTFPDQRVMLRLRYFKGSEVITKVVSKQDADVHWVMEHITRFCTELYQEGVLRLLKTQHTLRIPIHENRHHGKGRFTINVPKALKRDFGYSAHSHSFSTMEERELEFRKMKTRRDILEGMIRARFHVSIPKAVALHVNIPLARDSIIFGKGN